MSDTPSRHENQVLYALYAILSFVGMLLAILGIFWMGHKMGQVTRYAAALETDLAACRTEVADKDKEIERKDEGTRAVTLLVGQLRTQLWNMEEKFQQELHKDDRGVLNENPPFDP